jgi:hypothetical protein
MNDQQNATDPQWVVANDNDALFGIETIEYPNGGKCKRATLSDGRVAVVRRLKGSDKKSIDRITNGNSEDVQDAMAVVATKIGDQSIVIEDLREMWFDDSTLIDIMNGGLNFTQKTTK